MKKFQIFCGIVIAAMTIAFLPACGDDDIDPNKSETSSENNVTVTKGWYVRQEFVTWMERIAQSYVGGNVEWYKNEIASYWEESGAMHVIGKTDRGLWCCIC